MPRKQRFEIEWDPEAWSQLQELRVFDQRRIVAEVDKRLPSAPDQEQGPVKYLATFIPPWSDQSGVWQLSVVPFRVFYDVYRDPHLVQIHAVKRKPSGAKTGDIL